MLLQQAMDGSTSAAVITGGLDCKIIQWDTATRSMLSARHTGDILAQAHLQADHFGTPQPVWRADTLQQYFASTLDIGNSRDELLRF